MIYSKIALQILAAKECNLIKTNNQFWKKYSDLENFQVLIANNDEIQEKVEELSKEYILNENNEGFVCAFDQDFPVINRLVKHSEKPYILFYQGDLSLLSELNNNVAVIGLTDPTDAIEKRETEFVKELVKNGLIIVSGLAKGCDTIAHKVCLQENGKTIAILPSTLDKISPAVNRKLAKDIVQKGGLLITEYNREAKNRWETMKRYCDRDRLQAMFSKAVILTASYRKGEGDSGSRYAMEAAEKYNTLRYALYNENTDVKDQQFGLNHDYINLEHNSVTVLQNSSIIKITEHKNENLKAKDTMIPSKQMELF